MADQDRSWLQKYDPLGNTKPPSPPSPSTPPTPAAPDRSWLQNYDPLGNVAKPPVPQANQPSYTQSIARGAIQGLGGAPYATGLSPAFDQPIIQKAQEQYPETHGVPTSEQVQEVAKQTTPQAATNIPGKALESAGQALPLAPLFGPSGVVGSGISGGIEETLKEGAPGNPFYIQQWGPLIGAVGSIPLFNGLTQFAAKTARSVPELFGAFQSPLNKMWSDLGINQRIAGASTTMTWPLQIQNALRESLGGSGTIQDAEGKIFKGIEDYADNAANQLGPNLTQQELGERAVQAGANRAVQMAQERDALHNALGALVPRQTDILPNNFFTSLISLKDRYMGAPELRAQLQQSKIGNWLDALTTDIQNSPTRTLPYQTIQNMRTDIGEMVEKGIYNADVNTRELRAVYRALSQDMRDAYSSGTLNGQRAFDAVNAFDEKSFDALERTIQPLVNKNITPELVAQRITAQINKGSTRFDEITSQLEQVDPGIRNAFLGQTLRELGESPTGEFSPTRFYNSWSKLSPEMKGMFPSGMDKGLQTLAEASHITRDMFRAANTSHTSGNLQIMGILGQVTRGLTALTMGGGANIGAHMAGIPGGFADEAGYGGALAGYSVVGPMLESPVNGLLAKMWTSRIFNTWLGTQGINKPLSQSLASLGALVQQAPDLYPLVNYIYHTADVHLGSQPALQPGEKGRGFLGGGYATFADQYPSYAAGGAMFAADGGPTFSNFNAAVKDLNLSPQEQNLYKLHLDRLYGDGKIINPNGDISTLLQASPEVNGKVYNIPTLWHGKVLPEDQAVLEAQKMGLDHFPSYNNRDDAEARYQQMHQYMSKDIGNLSKSAEGYAGGGPGAQWINMSEGYAGGGPTLPANDNGDILSLVLQKLTPANPNTSLWDLPIMTKVLGPPANDDVEHRALGGLTDTRSPEKGKNIPTGYIGGGVASSPFDGPNGNITGYAQGGISHNKDDPRPFYNPQLPRVMGGGWAQGGYIENSAMGFAEGGATPFEENDPLTQPSILDRLMGGFGFPGGGKGGGYGMRTEDIAKPNETVQGLKEQFKTQEDINNKVKEAGFGDKTWYHGTPNSFEEIDPYQSNYGLYGMGAHFTDNPEKIASGYANKKRNLEGQTIHPVKLDVKNPIDMDQPANLPQWMKTPAFQEYADFDELRTLGKQRPITNHDVYKNIEQNWIADQVTPDPFSIGEMMQDTLKNMGHDAITHEGGKRVGKIPHRVMIVFDPEQIKSAVSGFAEGGPVDKVKQATDYLSAKLNIPPEVAKGAVKYMAINESKLDPNIVNPSSGAFGIAQDLGSRKAALFSIYGPKPTFENQLDNIVRELQGPEKRVLQALLRAKNEKQAYDIWGSMFERPGNAALRKAGVNYKPGDISIAGNDDQSILDQFLSQQNDEEGSQEQPEAGEEEDQNAPVKAAVNAAPWIEPVTKVAANRILTES